jgi:hypothetical protein
MRLWLWAAGCVHELNFFFLSGFVQYLMSFLISCCRIEVCTTTVLPLWLQPPSSSSLVLFVDQEYWRRITLIKRRHEIYQEPFFIASSAPCIVVSGTEMPLLSSSRNTRRPSSSQEQRRRPFLCPTAANKTHMQKIFSFCEIMCLLLEEDCKTFCILKFFFFFTRSLPVLPLHSDGPQEDFRLLDIMSSTVCYRAQH